MFHETSYPGIGEETPPYVPRLQDCYQVGMKVTCPPRARGQCPAGYFFDSSTMKCLKLRQIDPGGVTPPTDDAAKPPATASPEMPAMDGGGFDIGGLIGGDIMGIPMWIILAGAAYFLLKR